jgi:prevent-host-death family protein
MKTMVVSDFKAKCIAVLREAQRSGEPLLVTRRGRPLARIEPISEAATERRLGLYQGRMRIRGDIVHGTSEGDWEMLG